MWSGIEVASNQPGTTKYWHDGVIFGDVFSTAAAPLGFTPVSFWFY
jgi:hypothetical protein